MKQPIYDKNLRIDIFYKISAKKYNNTIISSFLTSYFYDYQHQQIFFYIQKQFMTVVDPW